MNIINASFQMSASLISGAALIHVAQRSSRGLVEHAREAVKKPVMSRWLRRSNEFLPGTPVILME